MTPKEIAMYYNSGTLGSFSTKLMDLFGIADLGNRAVLAAAFPLYAEAWELWFHKPEGWNNV